MTEGIGNSKLGEATCYLNFYAASMDGEEREDALVKSEEITTLALQYFSENSDLFMDVQYTLGTVEYLKGNPRNAIKLFQRVIDYLRTVHHRADDELMLRFAESKATIATQQGNEEDYAEAFDIFKQLAQACSDPSACFDVHLREGNASLEWALQWRTGSHEYSEAAQMSVSEFLLAEGLISAVERPIEFAQTELLLSKAFVAVSKIQSGMDRLRTMAAAVDRLSSAIEIAEKTRISVSSFYKQRAACRRELAKISTGQLAAGYQRSADADERAAGSQQ